MTDEIETGGLETNKEQTEVVVAPDLKSPPAVTKEVTVSDMMSEVDNLAYTVNPGSILWAKNPESQWFPCIVTKDAPSGEFRRSSSDEGPIQLHVNYLNGDEQWVSITRALPYNGFENYRKYAQFVTGSAGDKEESARLAKYFEVVVTPRTEKQWHDAIKEADRLMECSVDERLDFILFESGGNVVVVGGGGGGGDEKVVDVKKDETEESEKEDEKSEEDISEKDASDGVDAPTDGESEKIEKDDLKAPNEIDEVDAKVEKDEEKDEIKDSEEVLSEEKEKPDELEKDEEQVEDAAEEHNEDEESEKVLVNAEKDIVSEKEADDHSPIAAGSLKFDDVARDTSTVSSQHDERAPTDEGDEEKTESRKQRQTRQTESSESSNLRRSSRLKGRSLTSKSPGAGRSSNGSLGVPSTAKKGGQKRKTEKRDTTPKRKSARLAAASGKDGEGEKKKRK